MADLESRVNTLERQQTAFEVKFEMYMQRMDAQMERMEQRMDRVDQRMDKFEDKHDEDMREIRAELKAIGRHVQNLTLTAMAAIGAMGVSVVAFVWTILATR